MGTIFWEDRNPKMWYGRNVKNSARFRTTLKFVRESLRNASRYRQAENGVIYNPSHVRPKKNWINFGLLTQQSLVVSCLPTQNQHCAFSVGYSVFVRQVALLGAEFQPFNCLHSRTHGAGRPRVGL